MTFGRRKTLGNSTDLMVDAYRGWDVHYASSWAKQVEQYRPWWIEEAAHPEHFCRRWEVERYLRASAVSVVQADPEWCGGISELIRICAVASLHDAQVISHGHSTLAAPHVIAIQSLRAYPPAEKLAPVPVKVHLALPETPGLGIELDPSKVEPQSVLTFGS